MELRKALDHGERVGLEELEIFVYRKDTIEVEGDQGEVSETRRTKETDIFVRGIVNSRIGVGFTTDPAFLHETIEKVYRSAKANSRDAQWQSLPEPGRYLKIEEYDPRVEKMTEEDVVENCQEMIDLTPGSVTPASCNARREIGEKHCVNTNDIEISERGTWNAGYAYLIGKTKDGVTPGCLGIEISRRRSLNLREIVRSATLDVEHSQKSRKAETGTHDVIFHPHALDDLLNFTLFSSVLGENIVRGKSVLEGEVGSQLFSESLTVRDDPTYQNGVSTTMFDSEGVATEKTEIIRNGILKGYLWNNYWGRVAGERSTGNGCRDIARGTVGTKPSNVVIEPGDGGVFDTKDSYFVKGVQGAHSSNPESGEFSVVCNPAFRVENGEITGGCVFMISGTIYDLLKTIEAVGKKQSTGTCTISPLIRFSGVSITAP